MPDLITAGWKDYELIDFGNHRKLERFGNVILDRPEVNANVLPHKTEEEWRNLADAKFIESENTNGHWKKNKRISDSWKIKIPFGEKALEVELQLGKTKHIGIFPEQFVNWEFIATRGFTNKSRFLNLFAYTGIASLVGRAAGADVFHIESLKQLLTWGSSNMKLSGLENIHWVCEDALLFAKREVKRGRKYDFIILDPPVFGRGPKGEKWQLDQKMGELMQTVGKLLNPGAQIILNTYSPKITLDDMAALFKINGVKGKIETGKLCLQSLKGAILPMSLYARNILQD